MKVNPFTSFIAIGISFLLAYGFYVFNPEPQNTVLALDSFFLLGFALLFTIGFRFTYYRKAINTRTLSMLFFSAVFLSNIVFSFTPFNQHIYIILHGILFLLYILMLYYVSRPMIT